MTDKTNEYLTLVYQIHSQGQRSAILNSGDWVRKLDGDTVLQLRAAMDREASQLTEIDRLNSCCETLAEDIRHLDDANFKTREALKSTEERESILCEQLGAERAELAQVREQRDLLARQVLESPATRLSEDLDKLRKVNDGLNAEIQQLNKTQYFSLHVGVDSSELAAELQKARDDIHKASQKYSAANVRADSLRQALRDTQAECKDLRAELEEAKALINTRTLLAEMQATLAEMKAARFGLFANSPERKGPVA
jgi:chromosome segregation ATPase